jgi:uncharacterized membrane protein
VNLYKQSWNWFRSRFLSGVAIIVPVIVSIMVVQWLLSFLDVWLQPLFRAIFGVEIIGLGLGVTVVIILSAGVLTRNFLGRKLLLLWESILLRIPIVKNIYGGVKQVFSTFGAEEKKSFKSVVMVEYPSEGIWSLGFENADTIHAETGERWLHIFVMTAINPAGGFLIFVPESKTRKLNIPVESAIKMIVSGGIIVPDEWQIDVQ